MTGPQQTPQETLTLHYQDDGTRILTDRAGNSITLPSHLAARDHPQRGIGFQRPLAEIELQNGTHVRLPQHVVENAILHRPLSGPIRSMDDLREAVNAVGDALRNAPGLIRDVFIDKEQEITAPRGIIAELARTGGRGR